MRCAASRQDKLGEGGVAQQQKAEFFLDDSAGSQYRRSSLVSSRNLVLHAQWRHCA